MLLAALSSNVFANLILSPENPTPYASGLETSQQEIDAILFNLIGTDIELYKQNVGENTDSGAFASVYNTEFFNTPNDPENALITWVGTGSNYLTGGYLLVKDGNQNPAWYLFDLSAVSWNGRETLQLQNFWPNEGAISHVAFYQGNPVPEPATLLLFGVGFVGLASARLRRKNN
jgi:hypothetical protein